MITTLDGVIELLAINRTIDLSSEQIAVVRDRWINGICSDAKDQYILYFLKLHHSEQRRIKNYWGL